ncbi:MAG: hypothetical protein AAB212_03165 [Bacteroidota bacterium]
MGRIDAGFGSLLLNQGNKTFKALDYNESGLEITGQVRDIQEIKTGNKRNILFLRNSLYPVLYEISSPVKAPLSLSKK